MDCALMSFMKNYVHANGRKIGCITWEIIYKLKKKTEKFCKDLVDLMGGN